MESGRIFISSPYASLATCPGHTHQTHVFASAAYRLTDQGRHQTWGRSANKKFQDYREATGPWEPLVCLVALAPLGDQISNVDPVSLAFWFWLPGPPGPGHTWGLNLRAHKSHFRCRDSQSPQSRGTRSPSPKPMVREKANNGPRHPLPAEYQ